MHALASIQAMNGERRERIDYPKVARHLGVPADTPKDALDAILDSRSINLKAQQTIKATRREADTANALVHDLWRYIGQYIPTDGRASPTMPDFNALAARVRATPAHKVI